MANISLTQRCNRSCGYCFAQDVMRGTDRAGAFMSLEDFEAAMEFARRSGIDELKLLGGEPTIHPLFCRFLDIAAERGFRVLVLTGGVVPPAALERIERAPRAAVSVMMNVIPPGAFSQRERDGQARVMGRLGDKVTLGLNIDRPATPLDFLLEHIDGYRLARTVRLGLAHPIAGSRSDYLTARHYGAVGRRVAEFFWSARARGVSIDFDCGWVPCMFPDGFMEQAGLTPQEIGLRCNPIVDVLPGRQAISCYPLAAIATEAVSDDDDHHRVAGRFVARLEPYRPLKLYKHCDSCSWFLQGACTGGCIAGAMTRLRSVPPVN
jgi:radical SAM family protein/4Fe-4S single cluster protein